MPSIISYQKFTNEWTTFSLQEEHTNDSTKKITELCTIDDITYVCIPDGITLPPQPEEIVSSITNVVLTEELRLKIKAHSLHLQLIGQRMIDQIRAKYTIDDEMFFARIGVGAGMGLYTPPPDEMAEMLEFGEFVESIRQWGRAQRALLGL
ncbi:hypothetical protein JZU46_00315 [bacterium]|nr:hypothetical protein [bacterium]